MTEMLAAFMAPGQNKTKNRRARSEGRVEGEGQRQWQRQRRKEASVVALVSTYPGQWQP